MKRAWVTAALALGGVLSAGTATALVNAHVLDIADPQATETNRVRLPSPPTTVLLGDPTTSTAPPPTAAATVAGTAATTVATDPTTAAPPTLVDVPVGGAGFVTVDVSSGTMEIVSATPNEGWALDPDEPVTGGSVPSTGDPVSVGFRTADGSGRVDCDLRLVDGQVVGDLRGDDGDDGDAVATTVPTATDPPSTTPTTPDTTGAPTTDPSVTNPSPSWDDD